MIMNKPRKYKSIREVELKTNQVLIQPIKPLFGADSLAIKIKSILSYFVLIVIFGLAIYFISFSEKLQILGAFILGLIAAYVLLSFVTRN